MSLVGYSHVNTTNVNGSGYGNSSASIHLNTSGYVFDNVNGSGYANSSANVPINSCFTDAPLILPILLYATIFLLSLIGNSLTVAVIINGKLTRKSAHCFLLNMAVADLVVTVVYVPRMIARYSMGRGWFAYGTLGLVLCRSVPFLHHVSILASVFNILGVTVDRFCAMVFPLRNIMTRTVTKTIIIATWITSACLRFPYLVTPILKISRGAHVCATNMKSLFGDNYRIYERILMSVYTSSLLITILLYTILILILKQAKPPGVSNRFAQTRKEKASRKLLQMLVVLTICFILCWFVYFFAFDIFERPLDCKIGLLRFVLAHSNCAINPIILCVFNRQYRKRFRNIAKRIVGCRKARSSVNAYDGNVEAIRCRRFDDTSVISQPTTAKRDQRNIDDIELSFVYTNR